MKRNLLLFVALLATASLHAQSPVDDGAISTTENFDAVVPPMPASSYFTYGAGTSIDFINTVDISSTAANGAGLGVEFYYDASFSTDEEITLHTFSNVAPGDYIIQYDINADFQGFSFESVISDGTTDKPQTVGIQNGFGAFQKRYTAQITIGSISDLSFEMQMSPFVTGFTSSLVYIDNIELIKMNAPLTIPSSCTTLIQEEDYDAAVSPPPSSGFTSFTNSVALSAASDVNGTGQGVEFSYTAFYNEVPATIDLATFNNVVPGTYYIQYEFDESNTQTFVALSYYNEISDGSSDSLNYIVLDTVTGFAPQRTYPITISSTSDISLRFLAGETSNNIQGAASYYIDNVQLIEVGTGATTGTDTQVACDSYTWIDGNTYTASNNTATHVVPNAAGCDSTVTLDLTINTSTTGTDVQEACNSYTWIDGNTYTASNNAATFTLTNAAGCDSVVTLDLTIVTFVTGTDTQVACDTYTWIDGNIYTSSNNTATHTVPSAAGCDSIVTLDLTINNSSTGTDTQVACDSYTWIDGNAYTASNNTATFVLPNTVGCDSTVTLDLTINNSTTGTDTQVACVTYTWIDGNTYTSSNNTATHVVANASGCDSTVTLDLTINNPTSGTDTQTACNSFTWIDGNTYTSSNNTATFTLTNAAGCDSVVTLDLTINTFVTGTDTQVACDTYTWIDGNTYTSSNNTATHTLTSSTGCDSIVTLDLIINNSNTGTDTQIACDTYTWIDGNTYTSSNNTATFTLPNAAGCDSVVTLNLTINNSTTGTDTQVACDSYTWIDGNIYTSSNNTATHVLPNTAGCDSTVTLDLTINNSNTGTDTQVACNSYTWIDGNTYTSSNNSATFTLTNAVGCDSIVTLDLTINTFVTATDTQVACDSFTWIDGVTYTSSNNSAMFTLTTAAGCDSIVTLDLTINNSNTGTDTQVACDTYTWIDGNTYTSSNNSATFTLMNAAGCDSVVTLDLTILNSTTGIDTQAACDSYTWIDGNTYTSSNNSATFTLPNAAGCDSVVTLDLTINNSTTGTDVQTACEALTWIDGITYTTDNNTAQFTLTTASGCDSVVTLNLTISSVSNVGVTVNDPTLTADIPFVPGVSLQWLNCAAFNPVLNVVSTGPSFTPSLPGDYAVRIVENGCVDTSACYTITTADLSQLNNNLNSLSIYPNPSNGGAIYIDYDGTIEMVEFFDLQGRIVLQTNEMDIQTIDVSDLEGGEYLVRIVVGEFQLTKRFVKLN